MLQLSSPSRVFLSPKEGSTRLLWFGFIALFDINWMIKAHGSLWNVVGIPLLVLVIGSAGYMLAGSQMADACDEIWLDGDSLIVKNDGGESRVALRDVVDISSYLFKSGLQIRLTLRKGASGLGDSISFMAGGARGPFGRVSSNSIFAMLEQHIDQARQSSR